MMNRPLSFSQDLAFAVVAAGKGQRAGEGLPKVYRSLMGRPVFTASPGGSQKVPALHADIFVAISPDHEELFYKASQGLDVHIVYGGATRMLSVKACLEAMYKSSPRYVMVHDAARPFVTSQMIKRLLGPLQDENYPRYDGALPFSSRKRCPEEKQRMAVSQRKSVVRGLSGYKRLSFFVLRLYGRLLRT